MTTFEYLSNLPETVSTWTQKGVQAAWENQEVKKFLDSFNQSPASSAPQTPTATATVEKTK